MRQRTLKEQLEFSVNAHHHEVCYCLSKNLNEEANIAEEAFYKDGQLLRAIYKNKALCLQSFFTHLLVLELIVFIVGGIIIF